MSELNPSDPSLPPLPAGENPPDEAAQAAGPPSDAQAPRRGRSWITWLLRGTLALVFGLLVLVLGAVAWVVGTESGLKLAQDLAHRFAPELIQIEGVEGRLIDEVSLQGVRLNTPAADVAIDRAHLHWAPKDLLRGQLTVRDLSVAGIEVATKEVPPAPPEPESGPLKLPEIKLPLALEISNLAVEGLRVTDPEQKPVFRLDRLELAAAARASEAEVRHLRLVLPEPRVNADLRARVQLTGAYPLEAALDWRAIPVGEAVLEGRARVSGDLTALKLEHQLSGAADAQLNALLRDALERPSWQGELKLQRVDLPAFGPDLPKVALDAHLTTEGDLETAKLQGRVSSELPEQPEYGRLQAGLDVDWANRVLTLKELRLDEGKSKGQLSASGKADLQAGLGAFDLAAKWQHLSWPLQGQPQISSEGGAISVSGKPEDFRYQVEGRVKGVQVPPTRLQAEGTGNLQGTDLKQLRVEALEGQLEAKAQVAWAPEINWKADLDAKGINPGSHWADWKGRLGGRVTSTGALAGKDLKADTRIESLGGDLRGYPVETKGRVVVKGQEVEIDGFSLSSGPSRVKLEGRVGEALGVKFSLASPDLGTLMPGLAGAITAEGAAEGRLTAPNLILKLQAQGLAFGGNRLAKAEGLVDLGLSSDQKVRIDLDVGEITAGGLQWSKAQVRGDGKLGAHRLVASLEGQPLTVRTELSGGLGADQKSYSGKLAALELVTPEAGRWSLSQGAPFSAGGAKVQAGPLCLREAGGSNGCLSFQQESAEKWRAKLDWPSLVLSLIQPFLPDGAKIEGDLTAKADLEGVNGGLKGNVQVEVPRGEVKLAMGEGAKDLNFGGTALKATAGSGGLNADLRLPLAGLGGLEGNLALDGWRLQDPARPNQPLRGRLQARVDDLAPLGGLVPDVSKLQGRIDADVKMKGTLQQPGIDGYARLENGSADIPLLNLELRDIAFAAKSQGTTRLDYDGGLSSGDGKLKVTGQSRLQGKQGWLTEIGVKGDRITAANSKEYFALVSPDLKLEASPEQIRLGGEVLIPEARIRPRSVPEGTVTPSRDVIQKKDLQAASKPGPKVNVDLRVRLGEEVSMEGFGLRGNLKGDLRVLQEPGKPLRGDGQLAVVDGTYRLTAIKGLTSAGELKVEQGRVIYAKTPLDDPGVLIIANRQVGKVTASLRVSGTLRKPKMSFFSDSDPAMSQSQVLNYLLTGGASLGSGGSAQQVVEMGTYLSPKLYMQYENNLGDKTNKVKMRYDLTNSVQVQTESGDAQGVDVFYTFER